MLNIEKYQGVIFDFDGTLVDSMGLWHQIDHLYLARHGQECPESLPYDVAGKSFSETAHYFKTRFSIPDSIDTIMDDWTELSHGEYLQNIHLKPNALTLLKRLIKDRKKLAIATSNTRIIIEAYLKKHGLFDHFDALCFTNEVGIGKPNPAVFLTAASLIDVSPTHCLVFEDTLEGVQGAKAAGMDVVAVSDIWQGEHLNKIKDLADCFIKNFNELC